MTHERIPSRRAAALLIVLATLVLSTSAAAALLRLATTEHARRTLESRVRAADDLLAALDAPITNWLASEAENVVLPPDAPLPLVRVLDDRWSLTGGSHEAAINLSYEVQVTAFDQAGMVPLAVARSGSPLRLALPETATRRLDAGGRSLTDTGGTVAGLDTFLSSDARSPYGAVFPRVITDAPSWFGPNAREPDDDVQGVGVPPAFGALVATHDPGVINVMTAPWPLVEAAMRLNGRGDLDAVRAARDREERVALEPGQSRRQVQGSTPRIVTSSGTWAMRIDIRVGNVLRSWWAIYVRSGSNWECVQRLAISE